jgi:hypothetical protein
MGAFQETLTIARCVAGIATVCLCSLAGPAVE